MPDVTVLECASPYRTDKVEYSPGQVLHLSLEEAAHLLIDSRESFVVLATTVEGLEQGGEPVVPQTTEEIGAANYGTGEGKEPTDPPSAEPGEEVPAEASEETAMSTEDSPSTAELDSDAGDPESGEAEPDGKKADGEVADEPAADEPTAGSDEKKSRKSRPRRSSANA